MPTSEDARSASASETQSEESDDISSSDSEGNAGFWCSSPQCQTPGLERVRSAGSGCSVSKRLSFAEPKLLRATHSTSVMRNGASILKSSAGTGREYEKLSFRADHIDDFISHNWSTARSHKFLSLALHFNLFAAFVVAAFVTTVVFALVSYDVLHCGCPGPEGYFWGMWCQVSGSISFFLTLLFWSEVGAAIGCRGPTCFLDKCCIHQTDVELKRKGIKSLAAFLAYSWRLVVVYSDTYLKKLWTVYEMATFLLMFPAGSILVRPIILSKVVFIGIIISFIWAFGAFWINARAPLMNFQSHMAVDLLFKCAFACGFRVWFLEHAKIRERVRRFSITDAECYCEEDRALVEKNVEDFTTHFGFVAQGTPKAEALAVFDELVHKEVPRLLNLSFGAVGIPIEYTWAMFLPMTLQHVDKIACGLQTETLGKYSLALDIVRGIISFLALDPLTVAICALVTRSSLKLWAGVGVLMAGMASSLVPYCLWWGLYVLGHRSESSKAFLAYYVSACFILLMISFFIYRPRSTTQSKLRLIRQPSLPID